jgi:hypothetical protein
VAYTSKSGIFHSHRNPAASSIKAGLICIGLDIRGQQSLNSRVDRGTGGSCPPCEFLYSNTFRCSSIDF